MSSVNNGGSFFEKKSFSAVATALTGISRLVTLILLSENTNKMIPNKYDWELVKCKSISVSFLFIAFQVRNLFYLTITSIKLKNVQCLFC